MKLAFKKNFFLQFSIQYTGRIRQNNLYPGACWFSIVLLCVSGIPPATEDTVTVARTMRAASPPAMADQVTSSIKKHISSKSFDQFESCLKVVGLLNYCACLRLT